MRSSSLRSAWLVAFPLLLVAVPHLAWADDDDLAQQEDAEGCKDSPLVTRMPGAKIASCESKDFDEKDMLTGLKNNDWDSMINQSVQGQVSSLDYTLPKKFSAVQIVNNYQNALGKIGFQTVFTGKRSDDERFLTMKRPGKDGATWVSVNTSWFTDRYQAHLVIVQEKAMAQDVTADANALLAQLNQTGRVAVYGIEFDTGKATLKPESEAVLGQVLKLLQDNGELALKIEGHTDNVGKSKDNLALSKKRAAAVKEWLVKKGVAAKRLSAEGFGDTKPVASNDTEEGRAKNRRVELVKK